MILEIDTKEPVGQVEAEILAALLAAAGWVHDMHPGEGPTTDTGARHVPAGTAHDAPGRPPGPTR